MPLQLLALSSNFVGLKYHFDHMHQFRCQIRGMLWDRCGAGEYVVELGTGSSDWLRRWVLGLEVVVLVRGGGYGLGQMGLMGSGLWALVCVCVCVWGY